MHVLYQAHYKKFTDNLSKVFAEITKHLHWLTECIATFQWMRAVLDKLQQPLSSAPILAHPNFEWQFSLDTDASDTGIEALLSQQDDGRRGYHC